MSASGQFSFWKGSRRVAPPGSLVVLPGADPDLSSMLEAGRPLLLVARNSGSSGRAGCRRAVTDLKEAAGVLRDRFMVDVTSCMPDLDLIAEWLFASPYKVTSQTIDGGEFVNRFLVLDFRPMAPLVVSVSAGSARKEDSEFSQPHAVHLRNGLLSEHVAFAGFFAKNFDRLVRSQWATGLLLQSLRALQQRHGSAWGANNDVGRWPTDKSADLTLWIKGSQAQEQAADIAMKRVLSLKRLTGPTMIEGRVAYGLTAAPPPGLMTFRDRVSGRAHLALDTPDNYPDVNDTRGLPNVRDSDGALVDQVANVRWLLSQWALPGTRFSDLIDELCDRRFSTQGMRSQKRRGPAAHWGMPLPGGYTSRGMVTKTILRMFLDNMELYETGRLVRHLDGEEIVIRQVQPPGGWATAEDFARIRAHLERRDAQLRQQSERRSEWSWSGMPVVLDGRRRQLRPVRPEPGVDDHEVKWGFEAVARARPGLGLDGIQRGQEDWGQEDWGQEGEVPRGYRVPAVPDSCLTASMVEALFRADGQPLRPFLAESRAQKARRDEEQHLGDLRADLETLVEEQRRAKVLLHETVEGGALLAGAALRKVVAEEFESREQRMESLRHDIERGAAILAAAANVPSSGLAPNLMSEMINGLRDPRSSEVRRLLRDGVHNLRFDSAHSRGRDGLRGTSVAFRGDLVVTSETASWSVPFEGSYAVGGVFAGQPRALKALARLRRGEPRRGHTRGSLDRSSIDAAAMLAASTDGRVHETAAVAVTNIGDPSLLRLSMAAVFPRAVAGEPEEQVDGLDALLEDPSMIADFDNVSALAARITEVYARDLSRGWLVNTYGLEAGAIISSWRHPEPPRTGRLYSSFGNRVRENGRGHRWVLSRGRRPTFTPCPACGSRLGATMRLREVTGYLCLESDCRRDEAGVRWPSRFDMYVAQPTLYSDAGVALNVPTGYRGTRAEMVGPLTSPVVKLRPPRT